MNNSLTEINQILMFLEKQIMNGAYTKIPANKVGRGWGGADVMITSKPIRQEEQERGFFPDPLTVVTPYADQVGWLFDNLRDTFANIIDFSSKYEFFGGLAEAVLAYQQHLDGNAENVSEMLLAILNKAKDMLGKMATNESASN